MNDCYRILGISRHASAAEVRAAFLARMKVCHPDAGGAHSQEAAELSQAYWQLRDARRRSEHDALLFPPEARAPARSSPRPGPKKVSLTKTSPKSSSKRRKPPPVGAKSSRTRPNARRLDPVRAMAGVAACSLAIMGFAAAGTYFGSRGVPEAVAAAAPTVQAALAPAPARRPRDEASIRAAASEFRSVLADAGLAGAHQYARQCLMQLTARPTPTMLDYCLAFDDVASAWEKTPGVRAEPRRYFAADQRFGRYASAVREMAAGPVRDSMQTEVSFLARAED